MKDQKFRNALPEDHLLNGYQIQLVLRQSSSIITYLALDRTQKLLAVEEFFPSQLATRSGDDSVLPASNNVTQAYNRELKNFIAETSTLAQIRQACIPRVYPVVQLNNTAYRAMDFERGTSLQTVLNQGSISAEKAILDLLMPLLDGVEQIHLAGLVHGGIRPENIVLRKIGPPLLHGFGSTQLRLGEDNKPGPWADIYALAACFYPAIARQVIPDVRTRAQALGAGKPDPLRPAIELGDDRFSRPFLAAIDRALSLLPEQRLQSIADWRVLLSSDEECIEAEPPRPATQLEPSPVTPALDAINSESSVAVPGKTQDAAAPEVNEVAELSETLEPAELPKAVEVVETDEVLELAEPPDLDEKATLDLPEVAGPPEPPEAQEVLELAEPPDLDEKATLDPPEVAGPPEPPEAQEVLALTATDEQIVVTPRPPLREEAGIAAKRVLAKARAAAEEAAIERARRDAESAVFRKPNRRWLAATGLFIVIAVSSISVFYRLTYTSLEKPDNHAPRSAATVSADIKETSELDLSSLLNSAHCVSATAVIANSVIYLTGYSAGESATTSLVSALKQKTGIDRIQNNITGVRADKCALLEVYRSAWRSNQISEPAATMSTRKPSNVFRDKERLIIDLTTSDYPSYLYIDFFLLDGTVLHMIPSSLNKDNQAPARYQATIGDMGDWIAAPPFGEDIVVMLSSSTPLFKDQRPEHESADNYLEEVSRELERASKNQDSRITASFLWITTKPID